MNLPPVWSRDDLDRERLRAEAHFCDSRDLEPLEVYLELFDKYRGVVEEVMEETVDLRDLDKVALALMSDPFKREVVRYLTGPPVSEDDLKVLMKSKSLAPGRLTADPALLERVVAFVRNWHDRRRFPWISEGWDPKEHDRTAAIIATTALLAMRRVETLRRNEGKSLQEERVEQQLLKAKLTKVPTRKIRTLGDAPKAGEFCRESLLGTRKADFVIGLLDGRTMALECKVSNSATNSIKRLNNDAAAKAEAWRDEFGKTPVVPCAVLSGVYTLGSLENAQGRGLSILWAHELQAMTDWIEGTRAPGAPAGVQPPGASVTGPAPASGIRAADAPPLFKSPPDRPPPS